MIKLRLYNTMSAQVEEFQSLNSFKVGLYACGITAYDYTHLGHLRKYTMDDVLVRTLKYFAYQVKHVQNITDVGHLTSDSDTGQDKIEKGVKKYHKTAWELVNFFTNFFYQSMDKMGALRPNIICKASEHIREQLDLVLDLEKKGLTYLIEDDGVYFDTSQISDYGKLARLNKKTLKKGARVNYVKGKKNPTDFALWKFEKIGEKRLMVWLSPWNPRSFPGWHIECSAMSIKYLGTQFDIHTGGIDHISVHHTNEIAQSEAFSGQKPFVKYWVHHNFLRINGKKMSKSLNNFYTLSDLEKQGFHPRALRLLFLTTHYRSEMNFTFDNLKGIQKTYQKIKQQVKNLVQQIHSDFICSTQRVLNYQNSFQQCLANDLNTSQALEVFFKIFKDSNLLDNEKVFLIKDFDKVFALDLFNFKEIKDKVVCFNEVDPIVKDLINQRKQAKNDKNYQSADKIRLQLKELGYLIIDQKNGVTEIKKMD